MDTPEVVVSPDASRIAGLLSKERMFAAWFFAGVGWFMGGPILSAPVAPWLGVAAALVVVLGVAQVATRRTSRWRVEPAEYAAEGLTTLIGRLEAWSDRDFIRSLDLGPRMAQIQRNLKLYLGESLKLNGTLASAAVPAGQLQRLLFEVAVLARDIQRLEFRQREAAAGSRRPPTPELVDKLAAFAEAESMAATLAERAADLKLARLRLNTSTESSSDRVRALVTVTSDEMESCPLRAVELATAEL